MFPAGRWSAESVSDTGTSHIVSYTAGFMHYGPFWDCLDISGTAEARNFKFGAQIENAECYGKNAKLGQIGTQPTSHDLLLNFGTASISPKRRFLVPILAAWSTIEEMQN